jgi:hypothetical protein
LSFSNPLKLRASNMKKSVRNGPVLIFSWAIIITRKMIRAVNDAAKSIL